MSGMGPEFIDSVNAKTALETPQIVLTWSFLDVESPFCAGVPWHWENLYIRRSEFRYPNDYTDGDNILSEAYSDVPSTSFGDLTLEGLDHYYYSLILKYTEPSTSTIGIDHDVKRLGSRLSSVYAEDGSQLIRNAILCSGVDGVTVIGSANFDSAGSTFRTDSIQPGFLLQIDEGGADDGYYKIVTVNSEVQVTLDSLLTLNAANVDFNIYSDHQKFLISGIDYKKKKSIWRYDSHTQMVDLKLNFSPILGTGEFIESIVHVGNLGGATVGLSILTQSRYIRVSYAYSDTGKLDLAATDILNEWDITTLISGYEVAGAFIDDLLHADYYVYILDRVNLVIRYLKEIDGTLGGTLVLQMVGVGASTLTGLSYDAITTDYLIGNNNYIYSVPTGGLVSPVTDIEVDHVIYSRQLLSSDFSQYVDFYSGVHNIVCVDDVIDRLQTYLNSEPGYLWQQPYEPDAYTIGLYHLDEDTGNPPQDAGPLLNHAVNAGMVQQATGRFYRGATADAVTDNIDLMPGGTTFGADFDGHYGMASMWFAAAAVTEITGVGIKILLDLFTDANNYILVYLDTGNVNFLYCAGGVLKTIQVAHPSVDTGMHNYLMTWDDFAAGDEVKAYIDSLQVGTTQTLNGTWVGALAAATIGDRAAAATALGTYDEVEISKTIRVVYARVQAYTDANKMHAYSGRDYTIY